MIRTTIFAATIVLAGCGGGSGGGASCGDCGSPAAPLAAPQNLDAQTDGDHVTVTWDSVSGADAYQVYVSSDPALEVENYAAYDHSEWIQDADSPMVWTIPEWGHNYTIAVTATAGSRETDPAKTGVVGIFQVSPDDPSVVIDHSAGLEWKRCSEGQTWDERATTCLEQPTEYPDAEVEDEFSATDPAGWRIPSGEQLWAMVHCRPLSEPANNSLVAGCSQALDSKFPARGLDYPPYFVREPAELGVCRLALAGTTGVSCRSPSAEERVRALMVRNAE